ncbi:MAG: hypothetical protein CML19_10785 [Pusillimonas sp.]|nr:hypothetical protein [Pusillimonas sp.]
MPEENIETTEPTNVDNSEISIEEPMEPGGDYTVKIDGAEHQVTLEELQQGYQRQADYTRKTQELASERQRLQQAETIVAALEADPQGTLDALGGALGVQGNPGTQDDMSWEDEDPTTQRVAQLEAQVAYQAKTHRQQALDKEVTRLKGVYGEFDERELFQHALNNKIANLEAAYAHKNFGTMANYAGQLQRDADALDAKRKGAPVQGGKSVQEGAVSTDKTKEPSTLREAFALAKQQLGN